MGLRTFWVVRPAKRAKLQSYGQGQAQATAATARQRSALVGAPRSPSGQEGADAALPDDPQSQANQLGTRRLAGLHLDSSGPRRDRRSCVGRRPKHSTCSTNSSRSPLRDQRTRSRAAKVRLRTSTSHARPSFSMAGSPTFPWCQRTDALKLGTTARSGALGAARQAGARLRALPRVSCCLAVRRPRRAAARRP